jgi:hypothetical protein
VRYSRSLLYVLSFAVVAAVTAARPAVATAQDVGSPEERVREPAARALEALASSETRIAFGVRRGAIQHLVAKSPFDEIYDVAEDASEAFTMVTVHRFGQRAGAVRVVPDAPSTLRLGPSEEPFRIGPHPTIVWNLADRIRIAFGGRARSLPTVDPVLDRSGAPIGSITIEYGDRK